jgi:hypothetical protein
MWAIGDLRQNFWEASILIPVTPEKISDNVSRIGKKWGGIFSSGMMLTVVDRATTEEPIVKGDRDVIALGTPNRRHRKWDEISERVDRPPKTPVSPSGVFYSAAARRQILCAVAAEAKFARLSAGGG